MEKDLFIFNVLRAGYAFSDLKEAAPYLDKMGVRWMRGERASDYTPSGNSMPPVGFIRHPNGELRLVCYPSTLRGFRVIRLMDFYVGGGANEKLQR